MSAAFLKKNWLRLAVALAALFLASLPGQQARADNLHEVAHNKFFLNQNNSLPGIFLHDGSNEGRFWDFDNDHGKAWGHEGDKDDEGRNNATGATKVPEPGTLSLLICGLVGLFIIAGWRRRSKARAF